MSAVVPRGTEPLLRWTRPDAYHIRTECGCYSVARNTVNGVDWYIAFRRIANGTITTREIGATSVSPRATDEERRNAIRDMQQLCEAEASAAR